MSYTGNPVADADRHYDALQVEAEAREATIKGLCEDIRKDADELAELAREIVHDWDDSDFIKAACNPTYFHSILDERIEGKAKDMYSEKWG